MSIRERLQQEIDAIDPLPEIRKTAEVFAEMAGEGWRFTTNAKGQPMFVGEFEDEEVWVTIEDNGDVVISGLSTEGLPVGPEGGVYMQRRKEQTSCD